MYTLDDVIDSPQYETIASVASRKGGPRFRSLALVTFVCLYISAIRETLAQSGGILTSNQNLQGIASTQASAVVRARPFESEQLFGIAQSWTVEPLTTNATLQLKVTIRDVSDPKAPMEMRNSAVVVITNKCLLQCGFYDYLLPDGTSKTIIMRIHIKGSEAGSAVEDPINVPANVGDIAKMSFLADGTLDKVLVLNEPSILARVRYASHGQSYAYEFSALVTSK